MLRDIRRGSANYGPGSQNCRTADAANGRNRSAIGPSADVPAAADIYETRDNIVVLAEMPGVALGGVDITLERRLLTIRGRSATNDHAGY